MTSLDAIVTHLRQAVDHLHQAVAQVRGARDMAEELHDLFDRLGTHDLAERMQTVIDRAGDLLATLFAGIEAGEQLIAQTEAVRHSSGAGGTGRGVAPASEHTTGPPAAWAPPDRRTPPPHVVRAARDLPERVGDEGPTTGRAFNRDGKPLFDGPLVSGKNVASTAGLRPVTGTRGWPWTFTDHVETTVAGKMREPGAPQEVTLVLNNEPCIDDPYGCARILPHVLPAGSRLTVFVKDPTASSGVRYHRTYRGTGRGVTS